MGISKRTFKLSSIFTVVVFMCLIVVSHPSQASSPVRSLACENNKISINIDSYLALYAEAESSSNFDYVLLSDKGVDLRDCITKFAFSSYDNYMKISVKQINSRLADSLDQNDLVAEAGLYRLILELNEKWVRVNALDRLQRDESNTKKMAHQAAGAAGVGLLLYIISDHTRVKALIKTFRSLHTILEKGLGGATKVSGVLGARVAALGYSAGKGSKTRRQREEQIEKQKYHKAGEQDSGQILIGNGGVWPSPILLTKIADHTANETLDYANYAYPKELTAGAVGAVSAYAVQTKFFGAELTPVQQKKLLKRTVFLRSMGVPGLVTGLVAGVLTAKFWLTVAAGVAATKAVSFGTSWVSDASRNLTNRFDLWTTRSEIELYFERAFQPNDVESFRHMFDRGYQYRMAIEDYKNHLLGPFIKKFGDDVENSFRKEYICKKLELQKGAVMYINRDSNYKWSTATSNNEDALSEPSDRTYWIGRYLEGTDVGDKLKQEVVKKAVKFYENSKGDLAEIKVKVNEKIATLQGINERRKMRSLDYHLEQLRLQMEIFDVALSLDALVDTLYFRVDSEYEQILSSDDLRQQYESICL